MSTDVFDETLSKIYTYKKNLYSALNIDKTPSLYAIFHGGEPLMIGIDGFRKFLDIVQKHRANGFDVQVSVQTNGTLITDEFAELFKEYNFRVGVSIDGPRMIHDIFRVYRDGRSSFDKTCEGIDILNRHNVPWSAISVINKEYVGHEEEMFAFFKEKGAMEVDFTPSFFYDTEYSLPADDYASFMCRLFDIWIREEAPYEIRFFKDLLHILGYTRDSNKRSIICELSGQCHRNVSIGCNGEFYSCECLNSLEKNLLGNIMDSSLEDIFKSARFTKMKNDTRNIHQDCFDCDIFPACKGGCFNRRLPRDDGKPRLDFHCSSRKTIIHHVQEVCNKLVE